MTRQEKIMIALTLALVIWWAIGHPGVIVWEDGSFAILDLTYPYTFSGCIPGCLCSP